MAFRINSAFRFFLLALVSNIGSTSKSRCGDRAILYSENSCLFMKEIEYDIERRETAKSISWAIEECRKTRFRDERKLKWTLPKMETDDKRDRFLKRALAIRPFLTVRNSYFVWLSLRRDAVAVDENRPTTDLENWRLPKFWRWRPDNTTIEAMDYQHKNFWRIDDPIPHNRTRRQPDNAAGQCNATVCRNEYCVLAEVYREADGVPKLHWHDHVCEPLPPYSDSTNVELIACEAVLPAATAAKKKNVLDEWWFYLICAVLILCIPLATVGLLIMICRGGNRRRKKSVSRKGKEKTKKRRDSKTDVGEISKKKRKKRKKEDSELELSPNSQPSPLFSTVVQSDTVQKSRYRYDPKSFDMVVLKTCHEIKTSKRPATHKSPVRAESESLHEYSNVLKHRS